jgi:hypothetical protein
VRLCYDKKIKKETGAATVIKRKMELQKKLEKLPSHFLSKETNEITQQTCEATFSVDGSVECKQLTNSSTFFTVQNKITY